MSHCCDVSGVIGCHNTGRVCPAFFHVSPFLYIRVSHQDYMNFLSTSSSISHLECYAGSGLFSTPSDRVANVYSCSGLVLKPNFYIYAKP